jgi:hypothetical protein
VNNAEHTIMNKSFSSLEQISDLQKQITKSCGAPVTIYKEGLFCVLTIGTNYSDICLEGMKKPRESESLGTDWLPTYKEDVLSTWLIHLFTQVLQLTL